LNFKTNTCDIDGLCYKQSEKNPIDSKQECNPARNVYDWSVIKNASSTIQKLSLLNLIFISFIKYFIMF
jgi:hypothetical protein